MTKALMIVLTNATSEAEDEQFNDWYDNVHIPEITKLIEGVVAASRYRVLDKTRRPGPEGAVVPDVVHRYAAIYEIDAEDPEAVVTEIGERAAKGDYDMSGPLDRSAVPPMQLLLVPLEGYAGATHS